jgi:FkbM family methyltransferase
MTAKVRTALSKVLRLGGLQQKSAQLSQGIVEPRATFKIPFWYEWNYWEPTVQLALRDLCRAGDVVFDVGANAGALTLLMSRLVGPRGVVCAFEASPRIIDKCQYNLVANGCTNVYLVHRAVYSRSNEIVRIYAGTHLNDSLLESRARPGAEEFEVKTIALDDFVDYTGLVPKLVKMDVEGAEFEALRGLERTLGKGHPHVILEQQPDDLRCHQMLLELGYEALDLATYEVVKTSADFPPGSVVANVLFIHRTRMSETPYQPPIAKEMVTTVGRDAFSVGPDGSHVLKHPLRLPPGRFIFDVDFTAQRSDNEVFAGINADGREIFRYHTDSHFLSMSYRQWVVSLERASEIVLYLRFLSGTRDDTLDVRGVKVYRMPAFDHVLPPLID